MGRLVGSQGVNMSMLVSLRRGSVLSMGIPCLRRGTGRRYGSPREDASSMRVKPMVAKKWMSKVTMIAATG